MAKQDKLIRFDWAIKYLLRDKANFDILEGFLSALLNDEELKILGLLSEEGNQEAADAKFNRVDLLVEDYKKQRIIIEVQTTRESDYLERLLFGTSKQVVESIPLGGPYKDIKKVISVSILFYNLGRGDDYLYRGRTEFLGMNDGQPLVIKRKEESIVKGKKLYRLKDKNLFPEYYLIRVEKYKNIIQHRIDEWVYMIKNNEVKEGSHSKGIEKAKEKMNILNMTAEQKVKYEQYMMDLAREKDIVDTAIEEGRIIGVKKGEAIGLEKGEAIGLEKGETIGLEKGVKKGETKQSLKSLLTILILLPDLPVEKIAELAQMKKEIVENFLQIIKTKKLKTAQSFIQKHFLPNIELHQEEQKEIDNLVKKIFERQK